MKKFTKIAALAAVSFATLFSLNSCKEDEAVEVMLPLVADVDVVGAVSDDSATIAISAANAAEVYYTYYATEEAPAEADKAWESLELSSTSPETIKVVLSDLKAETEYTVEAYAQDKSEAKSSVFAFSFSTVKSDTPIISVADNTAEDATTEAHFTVSVSNATSFFYCYYVEDERPDDVEMTEVTVDADGDYVVDITGLTPSTEGRVIYTFEAYAVNGDVASEPVYTPFQTIESKLYTVTEVSVNPLMVTVDIDLTEGVCSGLAYIWTESENYMETSFDEQIQYGYAATVLEDTTFEWGKEYFLSPGTAYTLAVVPVELGEMNDYGQQTYTKTGEIETFSISTPDFTIGANDLAVNIEVNEASITATTLAATAYYAEGAKAFYYGSVATSEVADGDVAAYAAKTLRDSYLMNEKFEAIEYDYENQTSSTVIRDEVALSFINLSVNTEYYVFAVAITADGDAGQITTQKVTTKDIAKDASIKPEIVIDPQMDGMKATVTFGKCAEVYYYIQNTTAGGMSEENIEAKFINDMASPYSEKLTASQAIDGVTTFERFYLGLGETYDFYYMGVDADGAIGNLEKLQFETLRPSYESSAALNVTQNAELSTVTTDDYGTIQTVVLDVEMTGGAVQYIHDRVDSQYVNDTVESPADPEKWANYVIGNSWSKVTTDAAQISVDLYSKTYAIVLIPVDADGNYGTPVIFKTDMWEDGTDAGDGGTTGGGATPLNN